MLHALGITHVVSVGECALVPPLEGGGGGGSCGGAGVGPEYQVVHGRGGASGMPGSLWREEREGRIKVLDIKVGLVGSLWAGMIALNQPSPAPLTGRLRRRD